MTHQEMKARRESLGLTQTELAKAVGMASQSLSAMENNRAKVNKRVRDFLESDGTAEIAQPIRKAKGVAKKAKPMQTIRVTEQDFESPNLSRAIVILCNPSDVARILAEVSA